jgi:hypothetical protein
LHGTSWRIAFTLLDGRIKMTEQQTGCSCATQKLGAAVRDVQRNARRPTNDDVGTSKVRAVVKQFEPKATESCPFSKAHSNAYAKVAADFSGIVLGYRLFRQI